MRKKPRIEFDMVVFMEVDSYFFSGGSLLCFL